MCRVLDVWKFYRANHEPSSERIGKFVRAMIQTECCQSLMSMPEAAISDDVKGPRVSPGSELGGHGDQREWVSGVGVWSRRTFAITSPRREIIHFKTPHFAAEVHRLVRRLFRMEMIFRIWWNGVNLTSGISQRANHIISAIVN